jgi:hypothetical protein
MQSPSAIPGLEISPKLAHVKSTTYGRQAPSEKIRKPGKKSKPGIAESPCIFLSVLSPGCLPSLVLASRTRVYSAPFHSKIRTFHKPHSREGEITGHLYALAKGLKRLAEKCDLLCANVVLGLVERQIKIEGNPI